MQRRCLRRDFFASFGQVSVSIFLGIYFCLMGLSFCIIAALVLECMFRQALFGASIQLIVRQSGQGRDVTYMTLLVIRQLLGFSARRAP